jgi:alkyl hydroperoxide reductase subunit F
VELLNYEDLISHEMKEIKTDGVFIHVGMKANSEIFGDLLELNSCKEIVVEPVTGKTSMLGIWAAGDVTNLPYKQINIAMGDAIRAVLNIYETLRLKK